MKKKWFVLLYLLVILGVVGLLIYEYYTKGSIDRSTLIRSVIIILGAVLGMTKTLTGKGRRGIATNKVALYTQAYGKVIGNAFATMPKEQRLFYSALDDLNKDHYVASVKKLRKLEEECRGSAEQMAICHFLGWNTELLQEPQQALHYYERVIRISPNEITAQNMASCYRTLGNAEKERECLELSVRANPSYAIAHNNLGQYWIRMCDYEEAIAHLEKAHSLDAKLVAALTGLAICHAMEGRLEEYEQAYRKAVTLGYNGAKLKAFINSLEPPVQV